MKRHKLLMDDKEHVARDIEFARRAGWMANGIYYNEELASINGAFYTLFITFQTTDEQIAEAERQIRGNHDVVGMECLMVPAEMVAPDHRDEPITDEDKKIAAIRDVKKNGFNKVEGVALDGFSASAILLIYDNLNPENKKKYAALSIPRMADLAFRYLNDQREGKV